MKLQTIFIAVLAVVFGISAAVGVRLFVESRTPRWAETAEVLVASRDLPRYASISTGDVQVKAMPKELVPYGAMTKLDDIFDRGTVNTIGRGEVIVERDLSKKGVRGIAGGVPEGMRAITIRTPDVSTGVAGFTLPGSKVDVLLTTKNWGTNDPAGGGTTVTLLQNVEVLAVDQRVDSPGDLKVDAERQRSVTLLVTPVQAARLELGQSLGILHLTLRNPNDLAMTPPQIATLRELRAPEQAAVSISPSTRDQIREWLDALSQYTRPISPSVDASTTARARPAPPDIRTVRGNQMGWVDMK